MCQSIKKPFDETINKPLNHFQQGALSGLSQKASETLRESGGGAVQLL
jgi:hypothetical protein